jgi:hypothetical protein
MMGSRPFELLSLRAAACCSALVLSLAGSATAQTVPAGAKLRPTFEVNRGQFEPSVRYLARGLRYSVALGTDGATLTFAPPNGPSKQVELRLRGAATVEPHAQELQQGRINYLVGRDASRWKTGIETFGRVAYSSVLPGVEWLFYGTADSRLEYDLVLQPHVDVASAALVFEGVERLQITERGGLELVLGADRIEQSPPVAYQLGPRGEREPVEARFRLLAEGGVGFDVGDYDRERALVIDPAVTYSTYFGGSGFEEGRAVAVDAQGSVFLAGSTSLGLFPIVDALQPAYGGGSSDAFVCKLSPDGSGIVYATFIGGGDADVASGIAVDAVGGVYVAGYTLSSDFPLVAPLQATPGGASDAFLLKINPSGSALVYSTYLGGSSDDYAQGVAVTATGSARLVGTTHSSNFPTSAAFQSSFAGDSDAFVTAVNVGGSALTFSTLLGGTGTEVGSGVALDSSDAVYITGATSSSNMPVSSPLQAGTAGNFDGFVAKFSTTGSVAYSTYLGGSGRDEATGIAVDSAGAALIAGHTLSTNFPGTGTGFQSQKAGSTDAFVAKVAAGGGSLSGASYLGGGGDDRALAIVVDTKGATVIAGSTASTNFPLVEPNQHTLGGGTDAFVAKLSTTSVLTYSTYFGGSSTDRAFGLGRDTAGGIAVVGSTTSTNFPTQGALYPTRVGSQDAFVIRIPNVTAPAPAAGPFFYGLLALALGAGLIVLSRRRSPAH